MTRILFAALALLCGCLLAPALAQAKPPEGIEVKVEVGYNGIVHPARTNPVIVELDNQSADVNLSGDLILDYDGYEYIAHLELPTPSKKRFYLYFPCSNYPPSLTLRIRSKGYNDAFDLNRSFKTMKPEDVSVVVLTRNPGSLNVLNQQPIVHFNRNLYINQVSELASGKVFVSYYDIDEIDYNPKFFGRADAVVLGDIDYQQVTPELAESIKACAAGGTSIVFSLGLNGQGVAASPLGEICPLQTSGTAQVQSLGNFGRLYGISASKAPATFAVGSLGNGARALSSAGELPAIATRTLGSGAVTALAFDFEDVPFKQNARLVPIFMQHALGVPETVSVRNWFMHPQPVSRILKKLGEANPIAPSFVFLFLLAYIALVGPLNFLILGKLKRSTLVWTTIPLLVLAFTWFGIRTGALTRGSDNVTAYFQELHIYPDAAYTPYQTTMLVFTAERSNYELKVPDRSALFNPKVPELMDPYMASYGGGGGSALRGFTHGTVDNSTEPLAKVSQGKWTSEVYYYQGHLGFPQSVTSKLSATRSSQMLSDLKGTFTLDLPFDLYNCYLTAPFIGSNSSSFVQIGNLGGKGTYDIESIAATSGGSLPAENYLVQSMGDFIQGQRDSSIVGLGYRDEVLLVGFTQEVEAIAEFNAPHAQHKLNMVVIHLPYTPQLAQSGQMEVSRRQIEGGSGFKLQRYYGGIFSEFDNQQYSFDANAHVEESFEVSGDIDPGAVMHLRLLAFDNNNVEMTDLSGIVEVDVLKNGVWSPVALSSGDRVVRVPLDGAIGSERKVHVRLRALQEINMTLPDGIIPN